MFCLSRVETEGLLDYQGRAGIISIVRWSLRPVEKLALPLSFPAFPIGILPSGRRTEQARTKFDPRVALRVGP